MKKIILTVLLISVLISACKKPDVGDPKTQLAEFKKERASLDTKIGDLEKKLNGGEKKEKTNYVSITPLVATNFTHTIDLQGSVVADDEVYVNAKVPGALTKINISIGDRVSAGQVVAEIDDEVLLQSMEEIKKRYELATDLYNKQESLWKQNIGSEVQYLSAKNNKESLEKSMQTLTTQRGMYQIKAPISGVVDEVPMKIGMTASPGVPLAKIVNFNKLKVRVDAPETYAGKLRQGNSVIVSFPDLKKEIPSKISYVGSSVNMLNRTFKVEIPMKANEAGLLPNMATVVRVVDYSVPNALVIPINLIQRDLSNADYVVVADDNNRAKKVFVKTGQSYGDGVVILSGISAGAKMITTGYLDLNDGDVLKIQ